MKKILFLSLFLFAGISAFAQQKPTTDYMVISIDGNNVKMNMIVSRTDSTQSQQHLDLSLRHVKVRDYTAAYDSILLSMLKKYFDKGWKLVSTSGNIPVSSGAEHPTIAKYYLSREK